MMDTMTGKTTMKYPWVIDSMGTPTAWDKIFDTVDGKYLFQQYTCFKDSKGREIYEGDKVRFKYWVGDFAWEEMDSDEVKAQQNMLGKTYVGVVVRDILCPTNMNIVVGDPKSTHITFPLGYLRNSTVVKTRSKA